jgi:hypothetical protein
MLRLKGADQCVQVKIQQLAEEAIKEYPQGVILFALSLGVDYIVYVRSGDQ